MNSTLRSSAKLGRQPAYLIYKVWQNTQILWLKFLLHISEFRIGFNQFRIGLLQCLIRLIDPYD